MNTYFDKRYRRGNQTWTIQRYWQHKVHKTKTNKTKTPLYANKHT